LAVEPRGWANATAANATKTAKTPVCDTEPRCIRCHSPDGTRHIADVALTQSVSMKSSEQRSQEPKRKGVEDMVESHLAALFERLPMLCGFALRHDCEVTDVTVHTWPGYTAGEDLYEQLMQGLVDLAEEQPDAALLMRGRTFARMVH
jgi:hypothetical protein